VLIILTTTPSWRILEGVFLNAWRDELGDLNDYAKTNPTAQDLLFHAKNILNRCTCPLDDWRKGPKAKDQLPPPQKGQKAKEQLLPPYPNAPNPRHNIAHQNLLLTRDLMYMRELTSAISEGDFGQVEDLLPTLARIFCGAGSNNYCMEILHFIVNLKHIWTPEFA
jgi:hypothetical protein